MFEHHPDRRRFIRSRADLEFQLARITLALSRTPAERREDAERWFEQATQGLLERTPEEHRAHVVERIASIHDTFFRPAPWRRLPGAVHAVIRAPDGAGRGRLN